MKLDTRAVHAGDRKRTGSGWIPATTPIHLASSYFYEDMHDLDKVFDREMEGQAYSRYNSPTNDALEELVLALEGGAAALACGSGMAAMHMAVSTAITDRRRMVLAANVLYGATLAMLSRVFDQAGCESVFMDFSDPEAVRKAIEEHKPGALVMETIANPLLRVPPVDAIGKLAREYGIPLIVDNTFATPMMIRPMEYGAAFVVHSLTKFLSGHGDVLGGIVVCDEERKDCLRTFARVLGFNLGPFEAYLAMRGIKTFPLRFERQCKNAIEVAKWLRAHPSVERVFFPDDPEHPDAVNIKRLFPEGTYGAMVAFEVKDADKEGVFRFMNGLRMIVPATSLGDVHSLILYPAMASHRDISPKLRRRLGINDNLVRLSCGIEAPEDIIGDLDAALKA